MRTHAKRYPRTAHTAQTHSPLPPIHLPNTQIITKQEFNSLLGPASMHALGHIAANLSFAAVAISLTHTVKTLEPAFNVLLSRVVLGEATPLPAMLTLIPIMVRCCFCFYLLLSHHITQHTPACLAHPHPYHGAFVFILSCLVYLITSTHTPAMLTLIPIMVCCCAPLLCVLTCYV